MLTPTAKRSASPTRSATTSSDLGASGETTTSPACARACSSPSPTSGPRATRRLSWSGPGAVCLPDGSAPQIEALFLELNADERAALLERYKEEAIRSLRDVENANLKGLLRRVIGKIFNDTEIKGWCKEFEALNKVVTD